MRSQFSTSLVTFSPDLGTFRITNSFWLGSELHIASGQWYFGCKPELHPQEILAWQHLNSLVLMSNSLRLISTPLVWTASLDKGLRMAATDERRFFSTPVSSAPICSRSATVICFIISLGPLILFQCYMILNRPLTRILSRPMATMHEGQN